MANIKFNQPKYVIPIILLPFLYLFLLVAACHTSKFGRKFVFLNTVIIKKMYFDNYGSHLQAKLNPKLLWEYNFQELDFNAMKTVIVQRVIERGWPDDWYFILNRYGVEGVKEAIKSISYLNEKDLNFVSHQFDIPLNELKCYEPKRSVTRHWSS